MAIVVAPLFLPKPASCPESALPEPFIRNPKRINPKEDDPPPIGPFPPSSEERIEVKVMGFKTHDLRVINEIKEYFESLI